MNDGMQRDFKISGYKANGGFLLGCDVTLAGRSFSALPTRDAILPMLSLLALSKLKGCRLSALVKFLPSRFTHSDRIQNFPSNISHQLLQDLKSNQALIQSIMGPNLGDVIDVNLVDGVRVQFASGDIVHVRPSGNAPELRCYVESSQYAYSKTLCDACLARLSALKEMAH